MSETCGACKNEFETLEEVFSHPCTGDVPSNRGWNSMPSTRHATMPRSSGAPATEKQVAFLTRLAAERPMWADVENLHADRIPQLTKAQASAKIDEALKIPAETAAAAPVTGAQSTPKQRDFIRTLLAERSGNSLAEALREALNGHREAGTLTAAVASAAIEALLAIKPEGGFELNKGDIHVVDGKFVRVHIGQQSGQPYACVGEVIREAVWAGDGTLLEPGEVEWNKVTGLVRRLSAETKATAEQAKQFSRLAGRCIFCSHAIDTPQSTAVGYGPHCAAKYGLPWGSTVEEVAQTNA